MKTKDEIEKIAINEGSDLDNCQIKEAFIKGYTQCQKDMEITGELLQTIRERLEQVFFAKTNSKPDSIEMQEDGSFWCSWSWKVSYGGTDSEGQQITANDLTSDLDEMVKARKAKEEVERVDSEKRQKENSLRYEREQKEKRQAEFLKLKKEFDK